MTKKKLLVIGSGASVHTPNFIDLVKGGFDEVAFATSVEGKGASFTTHHLDFSFGFGLLRTIRRLRSIAKTFCPTIVHVHQANSYALAAVLALRGTGIPMILTAWGSDVLINPHRNPVFAWMVPFILRRVSAVTADSDHVLSEASRLCDTPLDTHNINFGITLDPCTVPKEKLVYSNRCLKKLYNTDKVLKAFSALREGADGWRLVVAGDGAETEALKSLARDLGIDDCTDFVGFVDPATNRDYYCRASVYVSIPSSDSISLSLVEALGYGCIPFVSDLPANREVIEDGCNGFIESDLDSIDLSRHSHVDPLVLSQRRDKIVKRFSKAHNRQLYLDLYERCIAP
jgi:L-malate glycosyltransferase